MLLSVLSEGGDIRFVALTEGDLPFLLEVRNECRNFLHDDREFTLEEARQWFSSTRPQYWVIYCDGTAIGYFRTSCGAAGSHSIFAGADIRKSHRGLGLGYKAWCAFLNWQFSEKQRNKVALEVLQTNDRARLLYEKLGFVLEGVKRQEIYRDGEWIDSILMSMLRTEWRRQEWARGG